jgi:hypothetical protein
MLATDFAAEKIMLDQGFTSSLLTDLVSTGPMLLRRQVPR